jgi:putative GTP pyrophosphokinase
LQLASPGLCWPVARIPNASPEVKRLTGKISKTQIDRLGDRLRQGSVTEADLRNLDEYRRSFGEAYETVLRMIREELRLEPTGRPAKSTSSLIEKLRRESIRLSQVQHIAGCRVVVADIAERERVIASLRDIFPEASVVDRRANLAMDIGRSTSSLRSLAN